MKIIKIFISILIALSIVNKIPLNNNNTLNTFAESCSAYEVFNIDDQGNYNSVGCYEDFSSAKTAMNNAGLDAVIKNSSSLSPEKIIAMTRGIAYTYPSRSNTATMYLYQHQDHRDYSKTTYVTRHRELYYYDTLNYDGNGNGDVHVMLNGFDGYVSLKDIDLVPMKLIELNKTLYLGGNDTSAVNEQPFNIHARQSYFEVVQHGAYKDLVFYSYSGWADSSTYPTKWTTTIGPAASWMVVGSVYYSSDGVTMYSDRDLKNKIGDYYNYYQFQPLRSLSEIEASVYDDFLRSKNIASNSKLYGQAQSFIDAQNTYGVNALMIYAMACLESAYGTSNYAIDKNNLFGWNAYDADPSQASTFSSVATCIQEQMGYNLRGYLDIYDARFFGMQVGNKGSGFNVKYASDPYWGMKIASIAYEIDKFANNNDGTLTDYNRQKLGIIDQFSASVRDGINGTQLYTTEYSRYYQKNFMIGILSDDNGWYSFQSTNPEDSAGKPIDYVAGSGLIPYNFNDSIAYVLQDDVKLVNVENINPPTPTNTVLTLSEFNLNDDGTLNVSGIGYKNSQFISVSTDITHSLVFTTEDGEKTEYLMYNLPYDNEDYKYARFMISHLNISDLDKNKQYSISIKIAGNEYSDEIKLTEMNNQEILANNYYYQITSDLDQTTIKFTHREIEKFYNTFNYGVKVENNIISFSGYAFIEGLNNDEASTSHEMEVYDLNKQEVVEIINLESYVGEYDPTLYMDHGLDYSYASYRGSADISNYPIGDYLFYIVTKVNDEIYREPLIFNSTTEILVDDINTNKYYQLKYLKLFKNRIELSVNKYQIDVKENENNLSNKDPYQYIARFDYDEQNKQFFISGSAYVINGVYGEANDVQYVIYLINEDTGEVFSQNATALNALTNDYSWSNSFEDFNYDYTWFETSFDATQFTDGNYCLQIKIIVDGYEELVELVNSVNKKFEPIENAEQTIIASQVESNKSKFNLQIKGLKKLTE